jgi:protein TonB
VPPPQRIEVALIAPPERAPPPPPVPPPMQRRVPVRERAPPPMPLLDATPLALPQLAAPQPPAIPLPQTIAPIESPIAAVPVAMPSAVEVPTAAPPSPPPGPAWLPPRFDAAYLDNPPPAYPPAARRAREQGRVLLRVLVSADGRAITVEVAQGSGSALLDEAAVDAVRRWRFVPARRGDVAVQAHVQVPIVFSLTR